MSKFIVRFDKGESNIIKIFRWLSALIAVGCTFGAFLSDIEYSLWILPVTYACGMFLLGNRNVVCFTPGIITLNFVMFCRYVILPAAMYLHGDTTSAYVLQQDKMHEAIFVMWFELLALMLSIYFTSKYMRKSINQESETLLDLSRVKNGSIICLAVVCILVVLVVRYPHLVGGLELLFKGYITDSIDISGVSGMVGILWKSLTAWLGIYYLYVLKKKNVRGRSLTHSLVLGIAIAVLISFIGQTTISRWYSVVTFCAMYFCAIRLFPDRRNALNRMILLPAVAALVLTSIYKNTGFLKNQDGMMKYFLELFDVSTLNAYFAGPFSVNNAVYLKQESSIGMSSMFYDLLRNFPVINHYINVGKSTVVVYANYLGRGDQILPLVGQSMIYFGYVFAPLLSVISVMLIRFFDSQYLKSASLLMYVYAFTACWLGLATILNFTICVSWFYVMIIPTFALILITERLDFKRIRI